MLIKKVQLFVFLKSLLICWHFKNGANQTPESLRGSYIAKFLPMSMRGLLNMRSWISPNVFQKR